MLVATRVVMAPLAVWLAYADAPRWVWLTQASMAALSDLYDGKLARRWGVVSAALRQSDSIADTIYALAVGLSFWFYEPQAVIDHAWGIGLVIFLEAARYPLDWLKFGRGASYHATSARVFGFGLLVAVFCVVGCGWIDPVLWIVLMLGIVSELEGVAISLILPEWTHDVKHVGVARAIRKSYQEGRA